MYVLQHLTSQHVVQVLLLGGGDQEGQMADAWLLDVGESAWVPMPATALPSARSWHSAHMLQREQVVLHVTLQFDSIARAIQCACDVPI